MSCCFSPDGTFALSASSDGSLKLWGVDSDSALRTLTGHTGWVVNCCFSPEGTLVLSASSDRTLKLWCTSTGALLRTLAGHGGSVVCCCFSPDGKFILSASSDALKLGLVTLSYSGDKTLKLWRVADGRLENTLEGHSANIFCSCFSPDGSLVLSGSSDNSLKLWCCKTSEIDEEPVPSTPHNNGIGSANAIASELFEHTASAVEKLKEEGQICAGSDGAHATGSKLFEPASSTLEKLEEQCHSNTVGPDLIQQASSVLEELENEREVCAQLELRLQACEAELAAERLLHEDERISARRAYNWLHAAQLPRLSLYTEYSVQALAPDSPLAELCIHLVKSTACKHREALGSTTFCPPPQFEVINVRSVVNPRLQHKYLAKLDDLE